MEELIEKVLNGDDESFNSLMNLVLEELYNIARIKLHNDEDVKDVIQETMINAYNNLHTLKHKEYFRTWIVKILYNQCKKVYKSKNKQINILNKIQDVKAKSSIEVSVEKVDKDIDFKILISELNDDEKIVMKLYYKYKYQVAEIADILNENVNTIKSRLLRAKGKIANKIEGGKKNG